MVKEIEIDKTIQNLIKINEEYKFISNIYFKENSTNEPNYYNYFGKVNTLNSVTQFEKYVVFASSLEKNQKKALLKVYAEALERYASSDYDLKKLKFCKYNELKKKTIPNLNKFVNTNNKSIKELKKHKLYWTDVKSYFDKKKYFLPSHLVYVPFNFDNYKLRHPITTGIALHSNKNACIYYAISEVIERGNFMKMYLNKESPAKILKENIKNEKLQEIIKEIEKFKLELNIFKINKNKEFSTILTIIVDNSQNDLNPAMNIGTSCEINIYSAIEKSILEALKSRNWIKHEILQNREYFAKLKNMEYIQNTLDRGFFWSHKENLKYLDFILKTKKIYEINSFEKKLSYKKKLEILEDYLLKNKYEFYLKNMNKNKLKQIHIYRAIIPQLHPLYLFESFKCDKGPGINKLTNQIPHPFL